MPRITLNLKLDLSTEQAGRLLDLVEMEDRDGVARLVADVFKGSGDIDVTTTTKRKGTLRPGVSKPPLFDLHPLGTRRN